MHPLAPGAVAPPVPGVDLAGPVALFFYKVTCPVCQLAAPRMQSFELGYPGRIRGIGQDPAEKLAAFEESFGVTFRSSSDLPPYPLSRAYGIRVVPTTVLVHQGAVVEVAESWDRDGLNALSRRLADLGGGDYTAISEPGDGLPPFRPG